MSRPNLKLHVCVGRGGWLSFHVQAKSELVCVAGGCQSSFHVQAKSELVCVAGGCQSSFHVQAKSEIVCVGGVSHVCIGLCPSSNFAHFLSLLCSGLGITEVFTRKANQDTDSNVDLILVSLKQNRDLIRCRLASSKNWLEKLLEIRSVFFLSSFL